VFSSFITVLSAFYFYFISKYWVWFQVFGWGLNLIVILGVMFIPESPKYLITMKRYDDCRRVITIIGKINGNQNEFDGKFDREVRDEAPNDTLNTSEIDIDGANSVEAPLIIQKL
jgi:hypothetical protein